MTKGWRYETNRHALAARGIETIGEGSRVYVRPTKKRGFVEEIQRGKGPTGQDVYTVREDDGWYVDVYKGDLKGTKALKSRGEPIVLDVEGKGHMKVSLTGADELIPLLKSRGIAQQAISAFISDAGSQHVQGKVRNVDVDVMVTHPGPNQYRIAGKINGNPVDRTVTKDQIRQVWNKIRGITS